jgi:hypothetical protein
VREAAADLARNYEKDIFDSAERIATIIARYGE